MSRHPTQCGCCCCVCDLPGSTPRGALQRSLCFLPCREQVTGALPLLLDLDRQPVLERWDSGEEDGASDEEFPELHGPFRSEQGDPALQGLQPPQSVPLPRGVPGEAEAAVMSGKWPQAQVSIWATGEQYSQGQGSAWAHRGLALPTQPQAPPCYEWQSAQVSQRPCSPSAQGWPPYTEPRLHPAPTVLAPQASSRSWNRT